MERPEGFLEDFDHFQTFGTVVSTEIKHTRIFYSPVLNSRSTQICLDG